MDFGDPSGPFLMTALQLKTGGSFLRGPHTEAVTENSGILASTIGAHQFRQGKPRTIFQKAFYHLIKAIST